MAKKRANYINNPDFLQAMIDYREKVAEAKESGKPKPQVPPYIGECFMKIATRLSHKPNFINYSFRDEMICDGIENCIQYIRNFDPEKSKNPFSYFTQIIYYAFLRSIQKEKKQLYVRYKSLENDNIMESIGTSDDDLNSMTSLGFGKLYDNMNDFIQSYEESIEKKKAIKSKSNSSARSKKKKKPATNSNNILQFASNLTEEEKL